MANSYDIVIIGAGTAGYSAALRAAELARSVALIDKGELGGTCVHRGCIPTKVMLYAAELMEGTGHADKFGIRVGPASVDWAALVVARQRVVNKLQQGILLLLKERGVTWIRGKATVRGPGRVSVERDGAAAGTTEIEAPHVIVATGSTPKLIGGLEIDGSRVITSDEALKLELMPRSIVVLGAGAVGVEFASLFHSFGAVVDVVEVAPRILPAEDADVSTQLARALEGRGMRIRTSTAVEGVDVVDGGVRVEVARPETRSLDAESLLVAVGRRPVSEGVGLEDLGLIGDRGFIQVDEFCCTPVAGLYAIGDVIDTPQLAHAAFAEGITVAELICGQNPEPVNYDRIPSCIYSCPEAASVGLTEEEARKRGLAIETLKLPFKANSKASVMMEDSGMAKFVVEKDGPIVGVHMVGPRVSELVSEALLVTGWEATPQELAPLIHPHPTLSEIIGEGALKLAGKPLHTL